MRTIPIAVSGETAAGSSRIAWGIRVDRTDGESFGWCSCDRPKAIDEYLTLEPGFDVKSLSFSSGLEIDNTEITIITDDSTITRTEIEAGRWDGAAFQIFRFNWTNPTGGLDVRMTGTLGNIRPVGPAFVAELRDLRQALKQDNTYILQPTCRYRFCDERCTLDEADFTHSLEVTSVADQGEFTDSAFAAATENFTEGEIRWLTGDNAGLRVKIRSEAAGVFELAKAMIYPIQVGDTADLIEGCLKTREACKGYLNILNFGGEPDKPTIDAIVGEADYGD